MKPLEEVRGIGPTIARKLKNAFITTAELLAVQNPAELHQKTGIAEGTAKKIIANAREALGLQDFVPGLQVEKEMMEQPKLTTGVPAIDQALMGGIESGSIVEFYGPAKAGKTLWCSQLAVRVQLPFEQGGLEGRVLWLDTENAFKPWQIRAMAKRFGLDPEAALGNIRRAKVILSAQIIDIFESIPQRCAEEDVRLVVIDSLVGLFRAEYVGLDLLRLRQQDLNRLLNLMRRTSAATGAVFVYTNQVMASIGTWGSSGIAPAGGHILSHGSDYRFRLTARKDDLRSITLVDNAGVPEFSIVLRVGWGGFYPDPKEKKSAEPEILEYLSEAGYRWRSVDDKTEPARAKIESKEVRT